MAGAEPPTPESATFCGLPDAESVKVRFAVRVPVAAGLNATAAEQAPPTDNVAEHVVPVTMKSDAFVPVTLTPLIVSSEVAPFDSVTDCVAVVLPTFALPKAIPDGLAVTTPLVPRPETDTVCGLLLPESAKFKVAVREPVAVGAQRMFAVQLAPAARVAPQVLLKTEKSPGLAPLKLMLLILMADVPELVSVTTFWPPLDPKATAAQVTAEGVAVAPCMLLGANRAQPASTVQTGSAVHLANRAIFVQAWTCAVA